jgi:hypothetical protein
MATRVLFVGGMPRSGSTLFDLMAGQLPGHCDVGELCYLWRSGVLENHLCGCGQPFWSCPFWTKVGDTSFGGWDQIDVHHVLALQDRVDTTRRLPLARMKRLAPRHTTDVHEYLDLMRALYGGVAETSGASVVVDSSKRPSTAHLLALDPEIDLAVAHVVRDPRGVVNSWNKQVALPDNLEAQPYSRRRSQRQTLRRYFTVNLMIEQLRAQGVPVLRVRYEDLVEDATTVMRDVLAVWGAEAKPDDLSFLTPEGLLTGGSHAVAGGRIRVRSGPMPLSLDESWRRELSPMRIRLTLATAYPLMRRYGYR